MNTKTAEINAMIAGVCSQYPVGNQRTKALKACLWRFRGPQGQFVGLNAGHDCAFVPESQSTVFDGRDNADVKLLFWEKSLGPLTVEILPQLVRGEDVRP